MRTSKPLCFNIQGRAGYSPGERTHVIPESISVSALNTQLQTGTNCSSIRKPQRRLMRLLEESPLLIQNILDRNQIEKIVREKAE